MVTPRNEGSRLLPRSEGNSRTNSKRISSRPTSREAKVGFGKMWKMMHSQLHPKLGGGNSHIFWFSSRKLGKIPMFTHIFQVGWFNHQPENKLHQLHTPGKMNILNPGGHWGG